jgi:hypothetical protein
MVAACATTYRQLLAGVYRAWVVGNHDPHNQGLVRASGRQKDDCIASAGQTSQLGVAESMPTYTAIPPFSFPPLVLQPQAVSILE